MRAREPGHLRDTIERELSARGLARRDFIRYVLRSYGAFVSASTLAAAAEAFFASRAGAVASPYEYEAVIVGSGFGGAVLAARLSKQWPGKVLLIERGKRYPRGSFPRTAAELASALMRTPNDSAPRLVPGSLLTGYSNGLYDLRSFDAIDVIVGNGYGGGSLIYAGATLEPSIPDFDASWPDTIKLAALRPYYDVFRGVLQCRTVPETGGPERKLVKLDYMRGAAAATGGSSELLDVVSFFGNDPDDVLPMGEEATNRHGAPQTSCTYCAECMLGCNLHAKNTLDLNYLYVAERRYGMRVLTERRVDRIAPLSAAGSDSYLASGEYGYRVSYQDTMGSRTQSVTAKRVILAAGSLGTTELLLRNKYRHGTLARVSSRLGKNFSPNGDFASFVIAPKVPDGHAYGPAIVQRTQYEHQGHGFVVQDASLPKLPELVDYLLDLSRLLASPWAELWSKLKDALASAQGQSAGFAFELIVGPDDSDGTFRLDPLSGGVRIDWSYRNSLDLHEAQRSKMNEFGRAVGAALTLPMPTYALGRNFTAHPLGGCALGDNSSEGVTSAARSDFGRVFSYLNLYVADGSLLPSGIGANPSLTIGALAEMVAEGITGEVPTPDL